MKNKVIFLLFETWKIMLNFLKLPIFEFLSQIQTILSKIHKKSIKYMISETLNFCYFKNKKDFSLK